MFKRYTMANDRYGVSWEYLNSASESYSICVECRSFRDV